jgi:hypothetical protein
LGPHSHHLLRRFVLLATLFVLALESAALAQETLPPPPPADAVTAATGQSSAAGQNYVRAVRITDVKGQVQVWQNGQIAFNQAEPNMPVVEGMRFVTGEDGRLEIEFEDGSVARLAPNSSFRLTQLRRDALGNPITRIDALTGLSYYELNGSDGQIGVGLGQDVATPQGNSVFRIDLDNDPSELAVMQGEVHIDDNEGVSVDIHPDQTFQTDPQQAGEFTVADSIAADSWDQWNSDRDQAMADLQSSDTTARTSTGNPDDASWNDLDYYGSWYNVPGYGEVWSPNGVSADWDPFGDGFWGYYPAFGYTWISAYPWGWWPYHCGAWDYLTSWGWIWAPNNCGGGLYGAGWFPYPTVGNGPLGYKPPMRPRKPGPGQPIARMIAVDRGPRFAAPFHFDPGQRPQPRVLSFNGTSIAPLQAGVHPLQRGPLGETFTTALVREHPELAPSGVRPGGMPAVHTPGSPQPVFRNTPVPAWRPSHPATATPPRPPSGGEPHSFGGGASRPAAPSGGGKPRR